MVLDSVVLCSRDPKPHKQFNLLLLSGKSLCSGLIRMPQTHFHQQQFHMVKDTLESNLQMQQLSYLDLRQFIMFLRLQTNLSPQQCSLFSPMVDTTYQVVQQLETHGTNITISQFTQTELLTILLFNLLTYMLIISLLIQQFMIFILKRLVSPQLEYIDTHKSQLIKLTQVFL